MQQITFTCELITPLFMSGADGVTPELRAPSIKGALRFWWRAMNGHLPNLKLREIEIFGGTSGDSGKRSSFDLRITQNIEEKLSKSNLGEILNFDGKINDKGKLSYRAKFNNQSKEGIGYLLYSTFMVNQKKYFPVESTFQLKLTFKNETHIPNIIEALKGLVFLGGIGTRSRRGAGSFKIKSLDSCSSDSIKKLFSDTFFSNKVNNASELEDFIRSHFPIISHDRNDYSHLSEALIYVFEPQTNWINALESVGKEFKNYRKSEEKNYKDTPNFGFPILHRNQGTTMQAGRWVKRNGKDELEKLERRSSPLIFKIIKTEDSTFYPIILWMNGELIPSDFDIMGKDGKDQSTPSTDIINDFFNNFSYITL